MTRTPSRTSDLSGAPDGFVGIRYLTNCATYVLVAILPIQLATDKAFGIMQTPSREFGFANLQRVNNGPTRCLTLLFVPPRRPHPRISAVKAMSIAANFLQKQQKQRGCAELTAETSDFERLLQLPQVPPGRCPRSLRTVWPHLRGLQPEEEAPAADPMQEQRVVICRTTTSCGWIPPPANLPAEREVGHQPRRSTGT